MIEQLRGVKNMDFVELTSKLAGDCSRHKDELPRLLCESIHLEETGAITAVPDRYSLFQSPAYVTGTGHGTPSIECRQVPVLVRVPGVAPMRSMQRANFYQVAPTVSALLSISNPIKQAAAALPLEPDPLDGHGKQ